MPIHSDCNTIRAKKTTPTLRLMAATIALATVLILGCTGDNNQPQPEPDNDQQALVEKIDRMSSDIKSLRQEVQNLRSSQQQETTGQPPPLNPTATKEPTPVPTPRSTPVPTPRPTPTMTPPPTLGGPGICARSPAIQKKILYILDAPLCQVISTAELFRITQMDSSLTMDTVKTGDFEGLVNLEELELTARNIAAGGFSGMENLREMRLTVITDGSIVPSSFDGLPNLERLSIRQSKHDSDLEETLSLPDFDNLPELKSLDIGKGPNLYVETLSETIFERLPALESVVLNVRTKEVETEETADVHLPTELFASNPELKKVHIEIVSDSSGTVNLHLPDDLFTHNPLIAGIEFSNSSYALVIKSAPDTLRHLNNLEYLRLPQRNERSETPKFKLSVSSPLYNIITYGGNQPYGYILIEPE